MSSFMSIFQLNHLSFLNVRQNIMCIRGNQFFYLLLLLSSFFYPLFVKEKAGADPHLVLFAIGLSKEMETFQNKSDYSWFSSSSFLKLLIISLN